jgi:hypothetical protein
MEKLRKLSLVLIIFALVSTSIRVAKAQASTENMKTFLDSKIPGIQIQVNATAETQPNQNITFILSLKRLTSVYVEYFNLSVFGFLNGTYKALMANVTDNNFPLGDSPASYNCTFSVPEQVWDVTYGEITLTYNATYSGAFGILELPYHITLSFIMTHVENVYLKTIEEQLKNLNSAFELLNQTFGESFQMNLTVQNLALLNKTYWELRQNYTELQQKYSVLEGSADELDNTRRVVAILVVTTVFFVATTFYLVLRKPKDYW